jgi:PHD/YefM family antitoxin component YafN of YafNO toxin-antitoxin module
MVRLPSHEVQQQWARVQDMALVEPVTITSNGCDRMVMMSAEEYHRLKRRDRKVMLPADFNDADVRNLENTRAPAETHAFDSEVLR